MFKRIRVLWNCYRLQKSTDCEAKLKAAKVLGEIGDPWAEEPLIKALGDEDGGVRQSAAAALGKLGQPLWQQWIKGDSDDIRRLCEIKIPRAVEPLIKALADKNDLCRYDVAKALGELKDPRAVEPLIKALDDKNGFGRYAVAGALGQLNDPRAVKPLIKALGDENDYARLFAIAALGELKDPRAVEPLIKALGDEGLWVHCGAAAALGELKDPRAVEPLIIALGDCDGNVRGTAAAALGQLKDPRAVEPLIKALGDVNRKVCQTAAEALKEIALLHPKSLIKQWEHIYLTVTKPHDDRQFTPSSSDCTDTHRDSGIGMDWPKTPPKTDF